MGKQLPRVVMMLLGVGCESGPEAELSTDQAVVTSPQQAYDALLFPDGMRVSAVDRLLSGRVRLGVAEKERCTQALAATADSVQSEMQLVDSLFVLRDGARENMALFHQCFLESLVELEHRLRHGRVGFAELGREFIRDVRRLWLLARALDHRATELGRAQDRYFRLLREAYLSWSQEVFGRNLEVEAEPLDRWPQYRGLGEAPLQHDPTVQPRFELEQQPPNGRP